MSTRTTNGTRTPTSSSTALAADTTSATDLSQTSPTVPTACGCPSRRESLVVAGVAVVGAAGLSACGAGEAAVDTAASAASSVASSAASAAASAAGEAIATAQIPVGGGVVLEKLKVVVTQPTAGDYKAFSAVCTHQGCTVASVADGVIKCPCHGSEFDIATGAATKGPATKALEAKGLTVGADGITLS